MFYEDYNSIKLVLNGINVKKLFVGKNAQQQWDLLSDRIKECEEKYIPSKIIEINGDTKYKDKLPSHIRGKIKNKHNLWKRYMETRLSKTYREYCKARNKVKNMIKYFRK